MAGAPVGRPAAPSLMDDVPTRPLARRLAAVRRSKTLRVEEIMSRSPIVVAEGTHLADAVEVMKKQRIRHLLVARAGRLTGVLSERHVRDALPSVLTLADPVARQRALAAIRVERVHAANPRALGPTATVLEAIAVMRELGAGSIPVVDREQIVGIVTASDLIAALEVLLLEAP